MSITLCFAHNDYLASDRICKKQKRISNYMTAMKYYARARGVSEQEIKSDLEGALDQIPLSCLMDAESVLAQYLKERVNNKQLSARSASNIRSDFSGLQKFVMKQEYFQLNVSSLAGEYAPPARSGKSHYGVGKGRGKNSRLNPYSLPMDQLPEMVQKECDLLTKFWMQREVSDRLSEPIREVTMNHHIFNIQCIFGFLITSKGGDLAALGVRLEDLNTPLTSLKITKSDLTLSLITEVKLINKFIEWGVNERWAGTGFPPNGYSWAKQMATTAKKVAQWQHRSSEDYDEAEAVKALSRLIKRINKRSKTDGKKLEEVPPSFAQCLMIIEWLRKSCAPRSRSRKGRTSSRKEKSIARSWQRYLICALLLYCAMRQRELRELELGRTLFRREDGYWALLEPDDHKNGSKTGMTREYPIPDCLTADLDEWLGVWRPRIAAMVAEEYPQNEHNPNLVFCALGSNSYPHMLGRPIKGCHICGMVKSALYRASSTIFGDGLEICPHRFRDIAVTHQREYGDPSQREALAEMMGHSIKTADSYYKKLTSRQITKKSKDWWKKHNPLSPPKPNDKPMEDKAL
jgi:integrase